MTEQPFERAYRTPGEAIDMLVKNKLVEEALHTEAFLNELFNVTVAESRMATAWLKTDQSGPLPPSLQRMLEGPDLADPRFHELVEKYQMRATAFRSHILDNLYSVVQRRLFQYGPE